MYESNVMGVMRVTKALLPALERSGNGHVVVIGSIAGVEVYPGGAGYTAVKHAAHAVTQTMRLTPGQWEMTTDMLSAVSTGMAVLEPGGSPHPPHQHPEEEFMIVASGNGEIEVDGKVIPVGPGAIMYTAGNTMHGIVNTGTEPMTFYWSKWTAKGA